MAYADESAVNRRALHILFAAAITLALLAALEGIARHFRFADGSIRNWYLLDPELGFKMHTSALRSAPGYEKADVVYLGDSIVYVPLLYHWDREFLLKDSPHRVAPLAVAGFGTTQEWLYLQQWRGKFPNLKNVILHFCLYNDFTDNTPPENPAQEVPIRPYLVPDGEGLKRLDGHVQYRIVDYIYHFVQMHWITFHMLKRGLLSAGLIRDREYKLDPLTATLDLRFDHPLPAPEALDFYYSRMQKGEAITARVLKALADDVQKQFKAKLTVLVYPHSFYRQGIDGRQLPPRYKDFFSGYNFDVYDLGCYFSARGLTLRDVDNDRVGHLSKKGTQVVAAWIEHYLDGKIENPECLLSTSSPEAGRSRD